MLFPSLQVKVLWGKGDTTAARQASQSAENYSLLAFRIGFFCNGIILAILLCGLLLVFLYLINWKYR